MRGHFVSAGVIAHLIEVRWEFFDFLGDARCYQEHFFKAQLV